MFSSPPNGHPTTYGRFVMDKYIKTENVLKRYLFIDFPVFIPYFPKRINPRLERRDFIPKMKIFSFLKSRRYS